MARFLFNHRSPVIQVVEIMGVVTFIIMIGRMAHHTTPIASWCLWAIVLTEYVFIRYCASRRWYRDSVRGSGIELQFKRAHSPNAYLLFLASLCYLMAPSLVFPAVVAFLLAVIAHINVILLYLARRDTSSLPVNCFSNPHYGT